MSLELCDMGFWRMFLISLSDSRSLFMYFAVSLLCLFGGKSIGC